MRSIVALVRIDSFSNLLRTPHNHTDDDNDDGDGDDDDGDDDDDDGDGDDDDDDDDSNNDDNDTERRCCCCWLVGWLLNVPATCQCISGTDLHRQFYVLPH